MSFLNSIQEKIKKNNSEKSLDQLFQANAEVNQKTYYVDGRSSDVIGFLLPNAIDTSSLEYLVVHDAGISTYYCGLSINKLPRKLTITVQLRDLFDFEGVTSSVFINPLKELALTKVNKRLDMLQSEIYGAERKDENRARELYGKKADTEKWARMIDSGDNTLYDVQFLFLLKAGSAEDLRKTVIDFTGIANKDGFELSGCYGAQLEAFLSSLPLNRAFTVQVGTSMVELGKLKKFQFDKVALSTIFNHVRGEFFHKNGVPIGRNLYSAAPVSFDPFDKVHTSYGMLIAGMPGYGKSATMKELYSRLVDFDDYHFVFIDYEPLPGAKVGEYAPLVESVGGTRYVIGNTEGNRINLYDVNTEKEYDNKTDSEYEALHLTDKIIDLTNILMVMATSVSVDGGTAFPAEMLTRMQTIISGTIKDLYDIRGIHDGIPQSLFQEQDNTKFTFSSGRVKKKMPTQHQFYMQLLRRSIDNTDEYKEPIYNFLLDVFEETVSELYYCPHCLKEYSREEYFRQDKSSKGERICRHGDGKFTPIKAVHGTRAYFDCDKSLQLDINTPMFSFDISQAQESERPMLMLVCQNFVQEQFIKRNSSNPKKARRLIFTIDEAHKVFPYPGARSFLNSLYRIARKRHVAPVLVMQSVADLARYKDTEDIVKNTETYLLFKHNYTDRAYIKEVTNITESQVNAILNLGGNERSEKKNPGQFCIVEVPSKRVCFVQADYLRQTESMVVETDPEIIAKIYAHGVSMI